MDHSDQFMRASAIYRNAERLGANTGAGFTVSPERGIVRFIRVFAVALVALAGLIVWSIVR